MDQTLSVSCDKAKFMCLMHALLYKYAFDSQTFQFMSESRSHVVAPSSDSTKRVDAPDLATWALF